MTPLFDTEPSPKMKPDGRIELRGRKKHPICPVCKMPRDLRSRTIDECIAAVDAWIKDNANINGTVNCPGELIQALATLKSSLPNPHETT